jgi:hypothetical protein
MSPKGFARRLTLYRRGQACCCLRCDSKLLVPVSFHQFAHQPAQAVNLVQQIEHDRHRLVIDTEIVAQIINQPGTRQVYVGKFVA